MKQTQLPGFPDIGEMRQLKVTVSFYTESQLSDEWVAKFVGDPRHLRLFPYDGLEVVRIEDVSGICRPE